MTVEEMLGRITSRELTEWQAFYSIEPFGEERAEMRNGMLIASMANLWRGKDTRPYRPEDFMLFRERVEPSPAGLKDKILAAFSAFRRPRSPGEHGDR
jgi:hypothetical protein